MKFNRIEKLAWFLIFALTVGLILIFVFGLPQSARGQGFIINPYKVQAAGGGGFTTNTTTKTWTFASSVEEFEDGGQQAGVAVQHEAADGNPAGSLEFLTSNKNISAGTEYAQTNSTGSTWQTWGVPSGATVIAVQLTDWDRKVASIVKATAHSIQFDVINDSGNPVHSSGSLTNYTLPVTTGSWTAGGTAPKRAVDASYQASSTGVRFRFSYTVTTAGGGGSADEQVDFDNVDLEITYYE